MDLAAHVCWRIPGRFRVAGILGPSLLRCVVFHNISETLSPFTAGIPVTITPKQFDAALRFLTAYYTPVRLQDVLTDCEGRGLPQRALLVTFDDAYAAVADWAAPICRQYRVPAVFFVNAAFLDNRRLAPDNLICYVANILGMDTVRSAARAVPGKANLQLTALADVFGRFLPALSWAERENFLDALRRLSGVNDEILLRGSKLYLTQKRLRDLASFDFEIGNHTYTHAHCRNLSRQDLVSEVDRNKTELEALTGTAVRAFSQPYGSSADLTPLLQAHLKNSGHEVVFLSESVANYDPRNWFCLDRVSTRAGTPHSLYFELEVLPRLRALRNRWFPNSQRRRGIRIGSSGDGRTSMGSVQLPG